MEAKFYIKDVESLYLKKLKSNIYQFVTKKYDIEYYNGLIDEAQVIGGFDSDDEFLDFQLKQISSLSSDKVLFYNLLIQMLANEDIVVTEPNAYNHLHPTGFFFAGSKVIMTE